MLTELFQKHASSHSTGTALLMFADMSLGKIYFANGSPTYARYREKDGREAVEAMHGLEAKSSVFHANIDAVRSVSPIAPKESEISSSALPAIAENPNTLEVTDLITAASLTDSEKHKIATALANYIGPVAHIMVAQQDPTLSVSDTISLYVKSIADPRAGRAFKRDVDQIMQDRNDGSK